MKHPELDMYNINQPLWPNIVKEFNWRHFRKEKKLQNVLLNERIVEIPFVLKQLGALQLADPTILDIGCVENLVPIYLASLGYQVWGLDIRPYPYTHPNFHFIQQDICTFTSQQQFDVALVVSTIEHIGLQAYGNQAFEDRGDVKALAAIHRLLKADGRLFLTVPFGIPSVNDFQRIYNWETLHQLVAGKFHVQTALFAVSRISAIGMPYWEMTSVEEAQRADSHTTANAVALCILQKT